MMVGEKKVRGNGNCFRLEKDDVMNCSLVFAHLHGQISREIDESTDQGLESEQARLSQTVGKSYPVRLTKK